MLPAELPEARVHPRRGSYRQTIPASMPGRPRPCQKLSTPTYGVFLILCLSEISEAAGEECPAGTHGFATLNAVHAPCNISALSLCVHLAQNDKWISGGVIKKGEWHNRPGEKFRRQVSCEMFRAWRTRPGSWVLDVGGNIGGMTLPLLSKGADVVTVEAHPTNAAMIRASRRRLKKSSSTTGRSRLFHSAAGKPDAPAKVCIHRKTARSLENRWSLAGTP